MSFSNMMGPLYSGSGPIAESFCRGMVHVADVAAIFAARQAVSVDGRAVPQAVEVAPVDGAAVP